MAKKTQRPTFNDVADAELWEKLEAVLDEHQHGRSRRLPKAVDAYPRFVISRETPDRNVGAHVRVRCALDPEPRGGSIVEQIGRAYIVDIWGERLIAHETEAAWAAGEDWERG